MANKDTKPAGRLSIITDLLVFALILIILDIIINVFDINFGLKDNEYEQLALVSDTKETLGQIEDENLYYINLIKNRYKITIYYGQDTKSYVDKVNANVQNDEVIINNNLKFLINELSKYPEDLFKNIEKSNYSISIVLVDSFNNDNLALASRNNLNEYKIYVSNNVRFARSFHHEMYHVLEYYIKSQKKDAITNWNRLNPENFRYEADTEKLDRSYVYYSNDDLKSAYFVSKYSKVNEKEDRAEVFAEIMVMNKKAEYLNKGENIYYKAVYIANEIHSYITGSEFYMDKFLD